MGRAFIVFPPGENRLSLQLFVDRVILIDEVQSATGIEEAKRRLSEPTTFDYMFVSSSFDVQELADFIEFAKTSPASQRSAYILVSPSEAQSSAAVANLMVVGIHSFLAEPYSLNRVEEAMELASSMKLQSSASRMRAAAGVTLAEILNSGHKPNSVKKSGAKEVHAIWNNYRELTGVSLTTAVVCDLPEMAPTKRIPQEEAKTQRKSVFESKLRENLQLMKGMLRSRGN